MTNACPAVALIVFSVVILRGVETVYYTCPGEVLKVWRNMSGGDSTNGSHEESRVVCGEGINGPEDQGMGPFLIERVGRGFATTEGNDLSPKEIDACEGAHV